MTPPTPAWYVKGSWPGSFVLQNFWPDSLTTPVAWTVAVEPFVISLPEPGVIVRIVVPLQPGAGVISAIVTCAVGCVRHRREFSCAMAWRLSRAALWLSFHK